MTDLKITTRATAAGYVVGLHGDLDLVSAPTLRQACEQLTFTAGQELLIDLTGLLFCDSTGVSTFIIANNHATSYGASLALACAPRNIANILTITGLNQIFTVYDNLELAYRHRE
jgi:anti-anti-sigma factor